MDFNNFERFFDENPEYKAEYDSLTDEEKQKLTEALKNAEKFVYDFIAFMREFIKQAVNIYKNVISQYPNKRVVHLALYSKKERTRKKNMHRIIKDFQK